MCKQSTKILQGYLTELLSVSDKVSSEQFVNSELKVTIEPLIRLHHHRKKRVSKEQRCSLLKKLLLKTKEHENTDKHKNGLTYGTVPTRRKTPEKYRGGLRDLINFTKNFDFGFKIENYKNYEDTPLEKLEDFSHNFFFTDYSDFKSKILYILENDDTTEDSEDEEMVRILGNNNDIVSCKIEEVIIEPDLEIKQEFDFEYEDEENYEPTYDYSSSFVEACYDSDSNIKVKKEPPDQRDLKEPNPCTTFVGHNKFLAEIIPIMPQCSSLPPNSSKTNSVNNNDHLSDKYKTLCSVLNSPIREGPAPTELLGQFVSQFAHNSRKTLSPSSIRCRTRGNPYINPQLQKQFQLRSFRCHTCNRRFKSPGYLNAHIVKLRH